jgi:DNA polymerase-1
MRLIEADYKGAELRVLAHMSGDEFLMNCFIEGRDLHSEVAIAFFGENFTHEDRMKAKTVNFGIPYGRTEFSLAEAFNMTRQEAQELINKWFARAPKAEKYLQNCADAVVEGRTLVTPFGRKRRFGLVSKDTLHGLQNEARNFTIQSVSSDLTLLSAMRCEDRIAELGGGILNLVHDSILVEVPDDDAVVECAIDAMKEAMENVPKIYLRAEVPFVAEFSTGYQWGNLEEVQ